MLHQLDEIIFRGLLLTVKPDHTDYPLLLLLRFLFEHVLERQVVLLADLLHVGTRGQVLESDGGSLDQVESLVLDLVLLALEHLEVFVDGVGLDQERFDVVPHGQDAFLVTVDVLYLLFDLHLLGLLLHLLSLPLQLVLLHRLLQLHVLLVQFPQKTLIFLDLLVLLVQFCPLLLELSLQHHVFRLEILQFLLDDVLHLLALLVLQQSVE